MSVEKTVYVGPYLRLEERPTIVRVDHRGRRVGSLGVVLNVSAQGERVILTVDGHRYSLELSEADRLGTLLREAVVSTANSIADGMKAGLADELAAVARSDRELRMRRPH